MLFTPALPILILSAAALPPPAVDPSVVTQAQSTLEIPDAIAPAVMPYVACLYAVRGLPFLLGRDGTQVRYRNSDGHCSAERQQAQADALKLLKNKPVPGGGTARAFVENALSAADSFVAALPVRQNASGSDHAPPVGLPFMVEDEVKPAYDHYEECLKTQVSYSPLTVETIMTIFKQAMALCSSVRESAIVQAENALVKKGWDAPTRTKAAESTFATADQSWLEMGRQFRESLIAHSRLHPRH